MSIKKGGAGEWMVPYYFGKLHSNKENEKHIKTMRVNSGQITLDEKKGEEEKKSEA